LFEALLCELPIITLDNGATGTVITHGDNGLLLPVGDGDRLDDALRTLVEDSDARDRLRLGARSWAQANLVSWVDRMNREVEWVVRKTAC